MSRKWLVVAPLLVTTWACGGAPEEAEVAPEPTEEQIVEQARAIHERILTIDTHDDIPFNFATEDVDPGVRADRKVDLPKMRAGGLAVAASCRFPVGPGGIRSGSHRLRTGRVQLPQTQPELVGAGPMLPSRSCQKYSGRAPRSPVSGSIVCIVRASSTRPPRIV